MSGRNPWTQVLNQVTGANRKRRRAAAGAAGKHATYAAAFGLAVTPLEDRVLPAFTTFGLGTLTVDFTAPGEAVTVTNDGTNITLGGSTFTGAGGVFATAAVTQLAVTDGGTLPGQTLTFAPGTALVFSGGLSISGIESVVVTNAVSTPANLTLDAGSAISLGAAVSAAAVSLTAPTVSASMAGTIAVSTSLTVSNTDATSVLAGVISGAGQVIKNGTGTIVVTAPNTYGGGTAINLGSLRLGRPAVAKYTFDGTAADASGNGRDGSLNGATGTAYPAGQFGQAFLGANAQQASVPYNAAFGLNSFTVSAWVNMNAGFGGFLNGILGTRFGGDTTFDLKVTGTNIHGDVGNGSGWINTAVDINAGDTGSNGQGGVLTPNTWHLITYVIDDAAKQFRLYLNGDLKKTIGYAGTPLFMKAGQTLNIGNSSGTEFMNGKIDDVTILAQALSTAEVQALYTSVLPVATTVTVAAGAAFDLNGISTTVGGIAGVGAVLLGGATLTTGATPTAFSGTMTGAGNLVKTGGGTLTLNAALAYTGTTSVTSGSLFAGAANVLPAATALTVTSGATFNMGGFLQTVGGLNGAGTVTTTGVSGTDTLTVGSLPVGSTFTGVIADGAGGRAVGLTVAANGVFTLGGASTYSGPTAVNSGVLRLTAGGPQFANAGFEDVNIGTGGGAYIYTPAGAAWTFGGQSGVSANGSAFGSATAADGTQVGIIQTTGTITQSVNFPVGGSFTVSFLSAFRNAQNGVNDFRVSVDGTPVGTFTPTTSASYLAYTTAAFTVAAGAHTIQFAGLNTPGGDRTSFIDRLSINPAAPAPTSAIPDGSAVTVAGILDLNGATETVAALAGAGSVLLGSGTLTVGGATTDTFSGVLAGAGGVTRGGTGTTVLTGANTYTGTTAIGAGATLIVGAGGSTGTLGTGPVTDNGALSFNRKNDLTVNNSIGGAGTLTQAGSGVTTLAGTNTYAGATAVTAGTLRVGTGAAQFANAGFEDVNIGTGPGAYAYGVGGAAWSFGGSPGSGSGLAGNGSAFNNPTALDGTQVAFLQATGTITQTVNFPAAGGYTISFFAASRLGQNHDFQVLVDGTPVGTFTTTATAYQLFTTAGFPVLAGLHTIQFAGINTLGGDRTSFIDRVTVNLPAPVATNVVPDGSAVTVAAGATLDVNGALESVFSLGGAGSVTTGIGTLTAGGTGTDTFSGAISGPGGFTRGGTGTTVLTGINTNSGPTAVGAGATLRVGAGGLTGTLGTGPVTDDGALIINRNNDLTVANSISGAGTLTQAGLGVTTLGGTNTYGGATTVTAGTLRVGTGAPQFSGAGFQDVGLTPGTFQYTPGGTAWTFGGLSGIASNGSAFNNPTTPDGTQVGILQQLGSISQTVTFPAAGTFTISFLAASRLGQNHDFRVLVDGTPVATVSTAVTAFLPFTTAAFAVTAGAHTIQFVGLNTLGGDRTSFIDRVSLNPTAPVATSALPDGSGVTVAAGATLDLNGAAETVSALNGAGGVLLGVGTLTVAGPTTDTFSGGIAGPGGVTRGGTGTTVLAGPNTYGGPTTVGAGAVLRLGAGGPAGTAGTGPVVNNGTLVFDRSDAVTFGAAISGTGGVVQAGSGSTTLTAANSYGGPTTVTGGTLFVNGVQTGPGATTVQAGGTLAGSGKLPGSVTINAAAVIAPGNSPGKLNVGTYTQAGTFSAEINGSETDPVNLVQAGVLYDQINVTGTVTITGALAVTLGYTPAFGDYYVLINNDGSDAVAGTFSNAPTNGAAVTLGGKSFRVFYTGGTGNDVVLVSSDAVAATVYSDDAWTGLAPGTFVGDADPVTPGSQLGVIGSTAFATVTGALANVTPAGTVLVNDGTYPEAATLTGQTVTLLGVNGTTAGTVTLNSLAGTGMVNISATGFAALNNTLAVGDGTSAVYAGVLAGVGGTGILVKQGTGTLALSGANTYGVTAVAAGTLQIGAGGAAGTPGTGAITVGGGAGLAVNRTDAYTLANAVGGAGTVTQAGTGTTTLAAANTYAGGTFVTAGVLAVSADANLGTAPGAAATNITLQNGATLRGTATLTLAATRSVAVPTGGAIDSSVPGATVTIAGAITADSRLVFGGAGNTTVTGTVGGTTTVTANKLLEGLINGAGLNTATANPGTAPGKAGYGGLVADPRQGQTNAGAWGDNQTWVYTGQFFDADGVISFGESIDDNTYLVIDGAVRLNDGQWNVPTGTRVLALGAGPNGDGWHDFEVRFYNGAGGAGAVGGNGWTATFGFGVNVNGTDGTSGTQYVDPAAVPNFFRSVAGNRVVKQGSGTLTLTAANTYQGLTLVQGGTVVATNSSSLGTAAGGTNVAAAAQLQLSGGVTLAAGESLVLAGNGPGEGGALLSAAGANAVAGPVSFTGPAVIAAAAGSTLTLAGTVALTQDVVVAGAGNVTVSGTVVDDGLAGGFAPGLRETVVTGNSFDESTRPVGGRLTLRPEAGYNQNGNGSGYWADNTTYIYTGQYFSPTATTVSLGENIDDNVVIRINGVQYVRDTVYNNPTATGLVSVNAGWNDIEIRLGNGGGGAGPVGGSGWDAFFGLGFVTPGTASNNGANFGTFFDPGTGAVLRSPAAKLVKVGTGTLTLSGANTYDGPTLVWGGVLAAASAGALGTAAGATVVESGATLQVAGVNLATEPLTAAGTGAAGQIGAVVSTAGGSVLGPVTAGGSPDQVLRIGSAAGLLTIPGINLQASRVEFAGAGNTTVTGAISGSVGNVVVPGLAGTYYNATATLQVLVPTDPTYLGSLFPTVNRQTPNVDFGDGTQTVAGTGALLDRNGIGNPVNIFGGLGVAIGTDNIGALWTGRIAVPAAETFAFTTRSDDGSRLWIDLNKNGSFGDAGELVVDNNFFQGMTNRTGTVTFPAAGDYPIRIGFMQGGGGYGVQASWQQTTGAEAFARRVIEPAAFTSSYAPDNRVIMAGTGTLTLSGANTYAGVTEVRNGVLVANNDTALGSAAAGTVVSVGATLQVAGKNLGAEVLTLGGVGSAGQDGALVSTATSTVGPVEALVDTNLARLARVSSLAGLLTIGSVDMKASRFDFSGAGNTTVTGNIVGGATVATAGLQGKYYSNITSVAATLDPTSPAFLDNLTPAVTNFLGANRIDFGAGTETAAGDGSVLDRAGSGGNVFGGIGVNVGVANVGAQWVGFLTVPESAQYTFTTRSDDGTVLWIDQNQDGVFDPITERVVDNNFDQGMTNRSGTVTLAAGSYPVRFAFRQGGGGWGAQFSVQQLTGAGAGARQIVPPTWFTSVSGDNRLRMLGTGTLTLTGTNSYTATDILSGTLKVGNNTSSGTLGTGPVLDNGSLIFQRTDAYTVGNVISGTGTLTQAGTGVTTLTANNTYAGGTFVNAGTLKLNASTAVNPIGSGAVTIAGGALAVNNLNALAAGVDSYYVSSGSAGQAGADWNNTARTDFGATRLAGSPAFQTDAVPASGVFNFAGSGAFYAGGPTTNFGVEWTGILTIGTAGYYTFNTNSDDGSRLWIDHQLLANNEGGHGVQDARQAVFLAAGQHHFRVQMVQGGGGYSQRVAYSGPDTANVEVTLPFTKLSQIAASGLNFTNAVTVTGSGTIDLGTSSIAPVTFGDLTLGSGTTLSTTGNVNGTLAFTATALNGGNLARGNTVVLGALSGSGAATVSGSGRVIAANTGSANTATAAVTVTGGELIVRGGTNANAGGSGTNNPLGATAVTLAGGNLTFDSRVGGPSFNNAISVASSATVRNVSGNQTVTLSGGVSIAAGKTLIVSSFGGSPQSGGATTVLSGVVSGAGNLIAASAQGSATNPNSNPGTVTLSNAGNSYTGTTAVVGGRLVLQGNAPAGANGVLGNGTSPVVVTNAGVGPVRPPVFDYTPAATNALTGALAYANEAALSAASGGGVGTTNFLALWTGSITVTSAGVWSFGTASDDGSALYVDLNGDGQFGPGELVVDNNASQGVVDRVGTVTFPAAGTYRIAVTMFQGGGGAGMTAKYAAGANVAYAAQTTLNPAAPVAGSTFTDDTLTAGQLTARWMSRAPAASDIVRYQDASLLIDGSFTVGRDIRVENSRANAVTLGGLSGTPAFTGTVTSNRSDSGGVNLNAAAGTTVTFGGVLAAPNNPAAAGATNPFVVNGAGTVAFAGNNLYTGATAVNGGSTLLVGTGGTAGTLGNLNATNTTVNGTLSFNRTDTAPVVSGVISGTGTVNQNGTGKVVYAAANTLTGTTNVNAGTLQIGNAGTSGTISWGNVVIAAGAKLTFNRTDTLGVYNLISGAGSVVQAGSGTTDLFRSTNNYSGGSSADAGVLSALYSGAFGTGTVTANGGAVRFATGESGAATAVAGVGGAAGAGWTRNGGAPLAATGSGTAADVLTLSDATLNTARSTYFNTPVELNAFTTGFTYSNPGPAGNVADGMTFVLRPAGAALTAVGAAGGSLGYAGGTMTAPSFALTVNIWSGNGLGMRFAQNGAFIGGNTSGGGVTFANGTPIAFTITYNPATNLVTATATQGANSFSITNTVNLFNLLNGPTATVGFTAGTGGAGAVQTVTNFTWTGSVIAAPNASYLNPVAVTAGLTGPVQIVATAANPVVTVGALTLGAGSTLAVTPFAAPPNQAYGFTVGQTNVAGAVALNVANNSAGPGTLTLGGLNDAGAAATVNVTGAGTVILSAAAVSVVNGTAVNVNTGTLVSNDSLALGTLAAVSVAATLKIGASQQLGALTGAGSVTLNGFTLTVGSTNNLSGTFAGSIANGTAAGNLATAGAGTVTLTGTNPFTGPVTVGGTGTLAVNGANIGGGATTVLTGATLAGTGTITGSVTANAGGTVSPGGAGPGVLATGSLTLTGTYLVTLSGTAFGTQYDQTAVTGTVTLGGVLTGTVGYAPAPGDYFVIIANDAADATAGTFTNAPANGQVVTLAGKQFKIFYTGGTGNDVVLVSFDAKPAAVYVDDAWAGFAPGQFIADADPQTAGAQFAIFGYSAFLGVQAGVDAAAVDGTVYVNDGTYATENVTVAVGQAKFLVALGTNAVTGGTVTLGGLSSAAADRDFHLNYLGIAQTLAVGASGSSTTYAGTVSGAAGNGTLIKQGSGTFTLTGTNTYGGETVIAAGTLSVPAFTNNGISGPLGQGVAVRFTGTGIVQYTGAGAASTDRGIVSNGGNLLGTIDVLNAAGSLGLSGTVTLAAGDDLAFTGPGTASLTGTGTADELIAAGAGLTLNGTVTAAALRVGRTTATDARLAAAAGNGALTVSGGTVVVTTVLVGDTATATGTVAHTGGALTTADVKIGVAATGTYTLSGGSLTATAALVAAVDGTGTFTQTGGTATVGGLNANAGAGALGSGTVTVAAGLLKVGSGGIGASDTGGTYSITLGGTGPTVRATANFAITAHATLAGAGANRVTVDPSGFTVTEAVAAVLSGAGGLIVTGSGGQVVLNGTNTFTGATAVTGATLGGFGSVTSDVTVNAGGSVTGGDLGGVGTFLVKSITFNGGTYKADFNGNLSDTLLTAGAVTANGGAAGVFAINSQAGSASAGNVFVLINNLHPTNAIANPPLAGAAEGGSVSVNGTTAYYTYAGGLGGNDFTLTATGSYAVSGATGKDYVIYRVDQGGANDLLQVTEDGLIIDSRPLAAALTGFTLVGSPLAGDDTLTVNFGASGGYFETPVLFDATSGGNNTLTVAGSSFDALIYDARGLGATSTLTLSKAGFGGPYRTSPTTVSFTGVELGAAVTSGLKAAAINIDPGNTLAGANALTLSDAAGANLFADLSSAGGAFTDLTVTVPTAAFTVNTDAADADTVTWASVDGTYKAATAINAGAADAVTLNAPLVLGSGTSTGSLFVTAGTVTLNAAIDTSAGGATGSVTLTAGSALTLAGNLQTDGGAVDLVGTTAGVLVATNVTIDTETGNDSAAGAVTFVGSAAISSVGGRFDLTINTDSTGAAAGAVTLVNVVDADGPLVAYDSVNDLFVSALGATKGAVTLPATIDLGGTTGDTSSVTVRGNASIVAAASIQTDDAVYDGGPIDLSAADVSAKSGGLSLLLLSEATAAGKTGGAVTLGTFSTSAGQFVLNLTVDTDTPATAGGAVTFGGAARIAGDLVVTAGAVSSNATFTAGTGVGNVVGLTAETAVVDGNAAGLNFVVANGSLSASAVAGVEFDTTVAKLGVTVTAGNATVRETDAAVLTAATVSGTYYLTAGGAVTQTAPVLTPNFRLVTGGDATLTNAANDAVTLAAAVTGTLTYTDANALTVGTLGATVGVTASNSAALTTGGTLTVTNPLTATAGSVATTSGGNLTVSAAVTAGTGATMTANNAAGSTILLNAPITGTFAKVFGGTGPDAVTVNASGVTLLQLDLLGAADTYTVNYTGALAGVVSVQDTGASGTDKAFLNGTSGSDMFEVNQTGFSQLVRVGTQKVAYTGTLEQITLDGGNGADTYNVQMANGPLPGVFTVADTGAAGTDTANVSGTSLADLFDVNFTTPQRVALGGENVDYTAGLETLNVFALDGNDTFRVKPTPNALATEINLFGGNPVAPVGDTVILNVVGVTNPVITNPAIPNGTVTSTSHKTVTWNSIETFPVPLGLGGTFDFNARNSPGFPETQPGYLPLVPKDTFAAGTYAGAAGWKDAVLGFDRNDIGLGVTGRAAALLSDGAWGYDDVKGEGVFRVVTGPNVVRVTLTAGDTYFNRDAVAVYANGEATPRYVFNTAAGEFDQAVFDVDMTGDADGVLELTIRDEGGYSYWTVNSLDVRPLGLVAQLVLPTAPAPAPADLPADGLTVDTYSGSKAQPGTVLTVVPVGGTGRITTLDADPNFLGTQVLADGAGNFGFDFLRGTGTADVTFTVTDVFGSAKTVAVQTGYDLPAVRKIDFGPAASPVQPGYLGFPAAKYTNPSTDALGWTGPNLPGEFSSAGGMGDLLRDGAFNRRNLAGVYHLDLPAGDYWVTATFGDAAQPRTGQNVFAVTGTAVAPPTGVNTKPGQYYSGTFKASTTAGGGLELGIDGGGTFWSLNALEIRPYTAPLTLGGPGTATADGTTPVTITGTGARANEFVTVTTDYGTIASPDASPYYSGVQVLADGSGNFSFQFTPAVSTTSASAKLTATGVFGGVVGNRTQALVAPPPVPPAGGGTQWFDFNANTPGPTAVGFTAVRGSDLYTPAVGYGWSAGQLEFERTAASVSALGVTAPQVPLYQDGAYGFGSAPGVFELKVAPGTAGINARVYLGDSYFDWPNISVQAEGGAKVTSPGRFAAITLTGSDANNDGVFTVTISNLYTGSIWVVNGIDVAVGGSLPGLPLTAAPDFDKSPTGTTVTGSDLVKTVDAAVARWAAAGATPEQLAALRATPVELGDLDGTGHYGENLGTRIVIDGDAAGRGWFVDPTPLADEEFTRGTVPTQLVGAVAGVDLLTVVMHEFGHTLGRIDLDAATHPGELMTGAIGTGERRLPATASVVRLDGPSEIRGAFVGDTVRPTAVAADKVFVGAETFVAPAISPKPTEQAKPAKKPATVAFDDELLPLWVG